MKRTVTMPKRKSPQREEDGVLLTAEPEGSDTDTEELLPEGKLVCVLTGEQKSATAQEETLQSFIEQLHREYGVALEDMERDIRISCISVDEKTGKERSRSRTVSLAVYEPGTPHETENITRVALVVSPGTKADAKSIGLLEEVLGNL